MEHSQAKSRKTVLVYSGGLDSTVLLYDLLSKGEEVSALSVDYGQRHRRELAAAAAICKMRGVEHRTADITSITGLFGESSLTNHATAVPDGHYADESMKLTVVPNRNMILLSLATAWAISLKADRVAYAAHSGDHTIYPDCRPEFTAALGRAIGLADWHAVKLESPFARLTKGQIVERGAQLSTPMELTWSCYKGGQEHCGTCGTCTERKEAFLVAGVVDPTEYSFHDK